MTIRYREIPLIHDSIRALFKKEMEDRGFMDSRIITNWKDVVGSELSNMYSPSSIRKEIFDEVQTIYLIPLIERSRFEFAYMKTAIVESINLYFGYKMVNTARLHRFG